MQVVRKTRETSNAIFKLQNGDAAKQAGSNQLSITLKSDDWKVDRVSVRMSIRDAQALRNFLNETLATND
jgi:hypothetical protein